MSKAPKTAPQQHSLRTLVFALLVGAFSSGDLQEDLKVMRNEVARVEGRSNEQAATQGSADYITARTRELASIALGGDDQIIPNKNS